MHKPFSMNKMVECRYGTKCLRKNCRYVHSHGREIDSVSIAVISPKKDGSIAVQIDGDLMPAAKSPRESNDWSRCIDFLQYIRDRTAKFPSTRNPVDDYPADLLVSKKNSNTDTDS